MQVSAVILTGGRSRRFDGVHKPGVAVGGQSTISRILARIRGLDEGIAVWVAGPMDGLSETERESVYEVREEPAFSGPLAGIAAAVEAISAAGGVGLPPANASALPQTDVILVLAGDMPMITTGHLGELISTCRETGRPAAGTDDRGKTQFLCTAWPTELLRALLADIGDPTDRAVKLLFAGLESAIVDVDPRELKDFDTAAELDEIRARLE